LYNLNPENPNALLSQNVYAGRNGNTLFYYEARLNWDRQFGKHNVGLMTVGMASENILTAGKDATIYETLPERNLGNSGRVMYDYDSRYFFEFAYGYNGSEKFTGSKQFGFFPSFGGGWIVSNEQFWEPLKKAVSLMKLKFTYGKVGNDAITEYRKDRFFYLSNISSGGAPYWFGSTFTNTSTGYTIGRYANPDICWEESTKYNLGLEFGFFKNEALKFQIDFFKDIRDKIYLTRENYPATSGFEMNVSGNVGKVSSKGIEGSIDLKHFFSPDFWITGRANFTYASNKILKIDEPNYPNEYLKRVGHSVDQPIGLVAERLFVDEQEIEHSPSQSWEAYWAGDIKYLDVNGDGVVTNNDRISMGHPTTPEIQYGYGLSVGYKKVDFSFFFQGNARVSFYIKPGDIAPFINRRNAPAIVARDSWSETNPDIHAFWPRLAPFAIANNVQNSSWWLREGSFVRLKTVELGYNLPGIQKIHLQSSRIYFSGENLFYFSTFKLWDPEVGGNGLGYPINRRFNVGIQLSF
jgi:TonB-linked SusC/RagA family outer membrane protein